MKLSEGYKEDLRNHYQDGYNIGWADGYEHGKKEAIQKAELDFRIRLYTLIDLDLLVPDNMKQRLKDLIRGGTDES